MIVEVLDKNYTIIHLHTDYSNGVTNIDSVTKYNEYIDRAVEEGMKAIAFTEHGNVFEYYKKHSYCKSKGIKYIHAAEFYLTRTLDKKIRDNYHCCIYAKNYEGFLELNKLSSKAFNREDGHYYYNPRISFKELFNTSDNLIISTACIGGVLREKDKEIRDEYIEFLIKNKHRCFLEVQHHQDQQQKDYNKMILDLHIKTGIPMIYGSDTHALNENHVRGRRVLQEAKNIFFSDEENWDIVFKSYNEAFNSLREQGVLDDNYIIEALNNTNVLADMIEEYDFNKSIKYPRIFKEPDKLLINKIIEGIKNRKIDRYSNYREYIERIKTELRTIKSLKAEDYILLQNKMSEDGRKNGNVEQGYGRGSVNGSIIAYILGITEMDSIKYNLNFSRFLNPSRVTNADIDVDYSEEDREWMRKYLFSIKGINAADIITFNTIALKGTIRDVGRAFKTFEGGIHRISDDKIDEIAKNIETKEEEYRREFPLLFEYVDILNGTIVSIGSHASGVLVSDLEIENTIGLCSLKDNQNPVTQLSMKPLDELMYTKMDVLGLDSIGIINETCRMVGIERISPDNVNLYDEDVWKSIRDDTTAIFQMESEMAHKYFEMITRPEVVEKIKKSIPNIRMFDLFMFVCGAIRPAGENFRDDACNGIIKDNGFNELNEFLHDTLGYLLLQEQIMGFLVKFCGYSEVESDNVRRAIAKKGDTAPMLEEIERRFLEHTPKTYNVPLDKAKEIIKPFLLDIKSASGYGFSGNHNNPYSLTGYIQGYLRYHYPLEFLTSCLNTWSTKTEKMARVTKYAINKGIKIHQPKFRYSKSKYMCDKETNSIYKGLYSIKYLNETVAEELYNLRNNKYNSFIEFLFDVKTNTSIDFRQLRILTTLNFFSEFGKNKKLLTILAAYENKLKNKNLKEETKANRISELIEQETNVKDESISIKEQIKKEMEYLGYITTTNNKISKSIFIVTEINDKYTPKLNLYCLNDGNILNVKCNKKDINLNPFGEFSIIAIQEIIKRNKNKLVDGEWVRTEEKEQFLTKWKVIA